MAPDKDSAVPSSPTPSQQPSSGALTLVMIFGLVVGAGVVFGGAALLWQMPAAWKDLREAWTETSGTVVASRVRDFEDSKQSTLHYVELEYQYVVDAARFAGASPAARQPEQNGNLAQATAIAQEYKPGHAVPVFYNPEDITASLLDAQGPNGLFWFSVFSGPLLIFSGLALASWSWSDWKAKRFTTLRSL